MSFDIGNFIGGEKLRVFREKVIVQKASVDDWKETLSSADRGCTERHKPSRAFGFDGKTD